jgi:nitrite reductase/ring-hydroxylating ferredoxin subunit
MTDHADTETTGSSDAFRRLIALDRCRSQAGVRVELDGYELAVFSICDPPEIHVIDNECPHAGGDLSAGLVRGGIVYCPWHEWGFVLANGQSTISPEARVRHYPSEVRDGFVYVRL